MPGADAQTKVLIARGYVKQKKTALAANYFEKVYKQDKKWIKGKKTPIKVLFNNKKYAIAGDLATEYLKSTDSKDPQVREIQVKSFEATKASPSVLRKSMNEMVALDPGTKNWWLKLAKLDLEAKDTAKAIQHSKTWVERHPKSVAGYKFLVPLIKDRKKEQATYVMCLDKLIELEPKQAGAKRLELGFLRYQQKDYVSAEKMLSESSKTYSKNAKLWFTLGKIRSRSEFKGTGVPEYEKAFQLEPTNLKYARTISGLLKDDKQIKANLKLFQLLGKNSPTVTERIKLAKSLYLNGNYPASAREWDGLLKMDQAFATSEPMSVRSFLKADQLGKAIKYAGNFAKDLDFNKTLADKLYAKGQKKEAVHYYEIVWGLQATDAKVAIRMAQIYEGLNQTKKAMNAYSRAMELKPDDKTLPKKYMELAAKLKDPGEKRTAFEYVVAKDPKAHAAHYELAQIYLKQKDQNAAYRSLDNALKISPKNTTYMKMLPQVIRTDAQIANNFTRLGYCITTKNTARREFWPQIT
jgi:tetratricopeptide (TPR) repeat protein